RAGTPQGLVPARGRRRSRPDLGGARSAIERGRDRTPRRLPRRPAHPRRRQIAARYRRRARYLADNLTALAKIVGSPYVSARETSRRIASPSVTAFAPVSARADDSCGGRTGKGFDDGSTRVLDASAVGGWRSFRPPHATLEPEDGALHLRCP